MNISRTHTQSGHVNWTKIWAYYAVHIGVSGGISFLVTGSWWIALVVSVIEPAVQVLAWLTQRWEQRAHSHSIKHKDSQSRTQRYKQRHAVQRYLARYARVS